MMALAHLGSRVIVLAQSVVAQSNVNGPSPVGRPEPLAAQRVADTAIWIFLLIVLAGAVIAALITRGRSGGPE